jgi:hypothetical protein
MKTIKAMCAATILALSLSIPASADTNPGDSHTPGRNTVNPINIGTPAPAPESSGLVGTASPVDGDISFPTLADILWALASIY